MKKSIASLPERLSDWQPVDRASYELGVCLGFWPDFGAPHGHDLWHGTKEVIQSSMLGNELRNFLEGLVKSHLLEKRDGISTEYRWNPNNQLSI